MKKCGCLSYHNNKISILRMNFCARNWSRLTCFIRSTLCGTAFVLHARSCSSLLQISTSLSVQEFRNRNLTKILKVLYIQFNSIQMIYQASIYNVVVVSKRFWETRAWPLRMWLKPNRCKTELKQQKNKTLPQFLKRWKSTTVILPFLQMEVVYVVTEKCHSAFRRC